MNLYTPLTSGVGLKGQILKLCRCKYIYIFFIKLSTKTYLTGICYDLHMGFMFCDFMFLSNNPSSGDINSSNLSCFICTVIALFHLHCTQLVTCLATDASLTADPGVASSIPARSHTFVEIDHEIISTVILLPSAESFKKGCCQLQAKVCARSTG